MLWLKFCLVLAFLSEPSHCDVFTSLDHMTKLTETSTGLIKYLRSLIEYQRAKIQEAEKLDLIK